MDRPLMMLNADMALYRAINGTLFVNGGKIVI